MRDREVVASITAGEPAGLATAYDLYAPQLFAYCRSMLREPADAADAVQDTFVIAAARLKDLRQPDRLRSWLYAVARNVCLRKIKSEKNAAAFYPAVASAAEPADSAEVSGRVELADLRALVRDAAGGLSGRDREMLVLRLWQGLDPAEAGAALGVTRGYANELFTRARTQLEVCVGVLLVARTGRGECTGLRALLDDWDGRLTVLLRKRLSRHVENCDTCSERRRRELVPALLSMSPVAAIGAAAAADAAGHAATIPAVLKGKALAAAGHDGAAAAVSRVGPFGKNGFPRPPHAATAWLSHGTHGQLATAAGGVAAAAAVVALALTLPGGAQHGRLANGASPVPGSTGPSGTLPSGAAPGGSTPGGSTPGGGHGGTAPAGGTHTGRGAGGTGAGPGLAAAYPRIAGPGAPGSGGSTGSTGSTGGSTGSTGGGGSTGPAPTSGAGGGTGTPTGPSSPPPTTPPRASPPPTTPPPTTPPPSSPPPPAPGTLRLSPTTVVLTPLLGSAITLTADSGPVTWSVSEPSSLLGSLSVSPSSGTLAAGHSTRLTITVRGLASLDTNLLVNGIPVNVILGIGL